MSYTEANGFDHLAEEYSLSAEQVASFQKKGHILLPELLTSSELEPHRQAINNVVQGFIKDNIPLEKRDTYGKAFVQVPNLWEESEAVKRFVMARRFAQIAAELLGVDGVRMYHDQALFKEPGGGHTPWHQDQIYWPLDTDKTVTLWMSLVDITEEVGTMTFASGSHTSGYINKMVISDESHKTLKSYIEGKGMEQVNYKRMNAGDATFHYGWTLHSAPGNPTDNLREVMTIIYYADGSRVAEPDSKARKNDLQRWFPGCAPGELAQSHLNPLVYQRE